MSTKCTILYNDNYHFYFDYKDYDYHLDLKSDDCMKEFLRDAGKILECCPFSNSGIYAIDLKKGTSEKMTFHEEQHHNCSLLEDRRISAGLDSRMKKCNDCGHLLFKDNDECLNCKFKKMLKKGGTSNAKDQSRSAGKNI